MISLNQEVEMADQFAVSDSVAQKLVSRSKARGSKGKRLPSSTTVEHPLPSLFQLLNEMGDAFPNNAEFDSFRFPSIMKKSDVKKIAKKYGFPSEVKIRVPNPGDRTCNWDPENLFVYKEAIFSGFRFPTHPFVVRLLAEAKVNPCQLYPNSWKFIFVFIVRCHKEGIPLNIPLFRSIFMFKNSPMTKKGWISIQHRPGVPHIVNASSFPDSIHNWQYNFVILRWKGGDWSRYFRTSFNHVLDPGSFIFELTSSEMLARDKLLSDNGQTHYREFINESALVEAGISSLSLEGNLLLLFCLP